MENCEIKNILMQSLPLDEVHVSSDGKHYEIIAIGRVFFNMTPVNKQRLIYYPLTKYIFDNFIHSLSIKTYTPEEWQYEQRLR